ncbi:MAG: serine/threonine protein kinase [Candidatus Zixiibacteriota bacterium]
MDNNQPQQILQYAIAQQMGAGKNGVSYKAFDTALQRPVILKLISKEVANSRSFESCLIHWRRQIDNFHPNLCAVYGVEAWEQSYVLLSEYVEGMSLRQLVEKQLPGPERMMSIAVHAAQGLKALYDMGVIHGNLSSTNVIVDDQSTVRLGDAGLGWPAQAYPKEETPAWLAPELRRGGEPTRRSDLYALGAIICEMTGVERPADAVPIEQLSKVVGPDWTLLVKKLLAESPSDRFVGPSELLISLEAVSQFEPEKAMVGGVPPDKHSPRQYLIVSLLMAVVIFFWFIVTTFWK